MGEHAMKLLARGIGILFSRRALMFLVRSALILSASFATGFGFLIGTQSPFADYDPYLFAVGTSAMFGAACGVIGLLVAGRLTARTKLHTLEERCEELSDRNWELKESEERAKSLLDAQGDLIIRRDSAGRITFVNDAYCRLAGSARETLLGSDFNLDVAEQGEVALEADGTRVHDQRIASPVGPRWIAWHDGVVRVDGETGKGGAEVQSVGRDVTARVEAERALGTARDQAEAASRAKSRFLAMVSHEIRTPLSGIIGMADLLLDTALTPEQVTYAKAVKTSGDALLSLIEEILDLSKIEAGRLDLEVHPFDLPALVEEVVELVAPRAQAKGLEIASYVASDLPRFVAGDVARLRQVLLNLAGNAVKFTERGGVAILAERDAAREEVSLLVRDTGIGISTADQERIFGEFEQADAGAARRFSGTGLGLAISRRIIDRMGGRIAVTSTLGKGSVFRVSVALPAAAGENPPSLPKLGGLKVAIAAAGAIESVLVARRLDDWGGHARVLAEPRAAATALGLEPFGALLVDHGLGREACGNLARAGQAIARRIVLITPAERHELPALLAAGFNGYLVKPIRTASLAARLTASDKLQAEDFAPREGEAEASIRPAAGAPTLSVLVAEDNEINALLVRALLTRLGHTAAVVGDGAAAFTAWQAQRAAGMPYDLVLMDLHMPGSDGIAATKRIRSAEAGGARTPIFALTADAMSDDRAACVAAGMDGFLVKPLDRERLTEVLAQLERLRLAA
jgi:PAS domain S-box-containing protein